MWDENKLWDQLVFRYDLDVSIIGEYFKYYDIDETLTNLINKEITINDVYEEIAEWAGIDIDEQFEMKSDTTFKEYLKENGFDLRQYIEEVHLALLKLGKKYDKADLYYEEDIERYFRSKLPVNKCAATIAALFDSEFGMKGNRQYEIPDEYDNLNMDEATEKNDEPTVETEESYKDWKLKVFKYLDKRIDVNKVKELSKYIKDFIKQEYDSGEPSWFNAAESVVNYVRTNYSNCLKDTSSDIK